MIRAMMHYVPSACHTFSVRLTLPSYVLTAGRARMYGHTDGLD